MASHDPRDADTEDRLDNGHAEGTHVDQLQVLLLVTGINFVETVPLIFESAEDLDDAVAPNDFVGDLRDLAHRVLDTAAVATERETEDANQHCDDREQDRDEDREARS